jgi:hypothetical protein
MGVVSRLSQRIWSSASSAGSRKPVPEATFSLSSNLFSVVDFRNSSKGALLCNRHDGIFCTGRDAGVWGCVLDLPINSVISGLRRWEPLVGCIGSFFVL